AYGVRSDAVIEVRGDYDELKPVVESFKEFPEVTQLVWYGTLALIPDIPGLTDPGSVEDFLAYPDGTETVYRILLLCNVSPLSVNEVYEKAEKALAGFACERVGLTDAVVSGKADLLSEAGEGFWEKAMLLAVPVDNGDISHAEIAAAIAAVEGADKIFSPFTLIGSEELVAFLLNSPEWLESLGFTGMAGEAGGKKYVLYVVTAEPSAHAAIAAALKTLAPYGRVLSVEMGRRDFKAAANAVGEILVNTLFAADLALCIAFALRACVKFYRENTLYFDFLP
ncbi:MAG: hypothetical protein IAB16_01980, partial [Firmicutes bacterium]|nr:hypothetical protein [Candidatus Stercoripulliclostridium pullicola]